MRAVAVVAIRNSPAAALLYQSHQQRLPLHRAGRPLSRPPDCRGNLNGSSADPTGARRFENQPPTSRTPAPASCRRRATRGCRRRPQIMLTKVQFSTLSATLGIDAGKGPKCVALGQASPVGLEVGHGAVHRELQSSAEARPIEGPLPTSPRVRNRPSPCRNCADFMWVPCRRHVDSLRAVTGGPGGPRPGVTSSIPGLAVSPSIAPRRIFVSNCCVTVGV